MSAPPNSKGSSSRASAVAGRSGFYLRPRTKIWAVALCFVLMIGASVWAVLQPVRPDPRDISWRASLLYPLETNLHARLEAVSCGNEYACRLNSVAINGTDNLPEVWAVGNVGLVLHRAAGKTRWEQLTITAVQENAAPEPTPTPSPEARPTPSKRPDVRSTPTPNSRATIPEARPSPTPASTPEARLTPTPTPTPDLRVPVPDLLGMSEDQARKIAESRGFLVSVENESGNLTNQANQSAQQSVPPRLVVVKQVPAPKTLAALKSTITITLGRAPRSAAGFLDELLPKVYAAEPEERPRPQRPSVPSLSQEQRRGALSPASKARPLPVVLSSLDDDLLHIACESGECRIFGRSGRIYKIVSLKNWSFTTARFLGVPASQLGSFSLLKSILDAPTVYAKAGGVLYKCVFDASATSPSFSCGVTSDKSLEIQIPGGSLLRLSFGGDLNSGLLSVVTHGSPDSKDLLAAMGNVRSAAFNSNLAVVVGEHGTILASTDNGSIWRWETQGAEAGKPNHRLPALWYWGLAALLMVVSSVVVAIPSLPPVAEISVADWTVTDAPLKPGDVDSLNFTPMALGLSRFIRNPKTQPPVTIAIEGEWGEGKSSVMSLLCGDLKRSRFQPVWFNAWHHQSEEQLLAALLEHIKDQGVPPWWHIDNWIFRVRLLRSRMGRKWPVLVILAIVFASTAAYELSSHGIGEFIQSPTNLIPYKSEILSFFKSKDEGKKPSEDKPANATSGEVKSSAPTLFSEKPSAPKTCNSEAECNPADLRHLGLIASFLGLLGAIFKIAKTFGIDSSKLTDNLRDATSIKDIKPDPGIRRQFAREFGDFCEAWSWGGRRVIIFIDDLDRCRPESVVTVLESINFLTTAGDCMIVLGMAQEQVTHCVGLGFKDIAQSQAAYLGGGDSEKEKAVARFKYGELYIKKLVNIVAPLPKTSSDQRRRMLESRAAEMRQREEQRKTTGLSKLREKVWAWLSESGSLGVKMGPATAMLLAVLISAVVGYEKGISSAPAVEQTAINNSPSSPSSGIPEPRPQPTPTPSKSREAKALVYDRPTSQPAKLIEPTVKARGSWWSYSVNASLLVIFLGLLGYQLSTRTNQDAQNSPDFEKSLALWGEFIVGLCNTPREIKRALNDLRYQAMTRRMNGPSSTRGERLVKALRNFVTGWKETEAVETRVDEAALPPLKAAALANLSDAEEKLFLDQAAVAAYPGISERMTLLLELKEKHMKEFSRWIGPPAAKAAEA